MTFGVAIIGDLGRGWLGVEEEYDARLHECWAALWSRCALLRNLDVYFVGSGTSPAWQEHSQADVDAEEGGLAHALAELCRRERLERLLLIDVYSPLSVLVLDEVSSSVLQNPKEYEAVFCNSDFPCGLRVIGVSVSVLEQSAGLLQSPLDGANYETFLLNPVLFPQKPLATPKLKVVRRRCRFCALLLEEDLARMEEALREHREKSDENLLALASYRTSGAQSRRCRIGKWVSIVEKTYALKEELLPREPLILMGGRLDGHCGSVLETLYHDEKYRPVAVLDRADRLYGALVENIPVIGSTEDLDLVPPNFRFFPAVGDNDGRRSLHRDADRQGKKFITLRHPTAVVSKQAKIGEGVFLGAACVVNHGATIGDCAIVNTGAVIEHDCTVEEYSHVGPGARLAGRVKVRQGAFVGIGASIIPDVTVGKDCFVGAGSPVVRDVPDNQTLGAAKPRMYMSSSENIYSSRRRDNEGTEIMPVAQPTLPLFDNLAARMKDIFQTKMLSNFGKQCEQLEERVAKYLGVGHCVAITSGTTGLLLLIRALGFEEGEIIVPSFTFGATGIAIVWNGLEPVFADIEESSFNLDPDSVKERITARTRAVLGVHIFGNPCSPDKLEHLCYEHEIPLLFDAAHAFGSVWNQQKVGSFGMAEVFSLSGTKIITAGEGGLITTDDSALAEKLRLLRNYGSGADYNIMTFGLNGKMSEFHAAMALETLGRVDELIARRLSLVDRYMDNLADLKGVRYQQVASPAVSVYKDLAILIDESTTGVTRDQVEADLRSLRIQTKKYFYPPLHMMTAFKRYCREDHHLRVTQKVAGQVLCLPLFSHMTDEQVDLVSEAVRNSVTKGH
ncbi:MAG: NeuD/PglB/VioB family sugar acetyltransferase [Phycisphaerae bacterium]|nr:NeuD/PglB/VioB family sugar acetyltransferase [Phycisphaerae bacterium]